MCIQDTGFNRLLKRVRLHYHSKACPTLKEKKWTLLLDEFITLALTSTFSSDESELYNPLAGFRGQQQRGLVGPGKSLSPWKKNSDIQFST